MSIKIFDYKKVNKSDEFEDIPILDIGPYLAGVSGAAESLAENIRFIQETIGFYVVINHGVAPEVMDNAYSALRRFFARPKEEKLKLENERLNKTKIVEKNMFKYFNLPSSSRIVIECNVINLIKKKEFLYIYFTKRALKKRFDNLYLIG